MTALILAAAVDLASGFVEVPMSARPQTWWHWMNGNVTREGITADLEAMKAIGLGGAHIFDAGCDIPRGSLKFGTDEWFDTVAFAGKEAERLGMELTTTSCSGWSCAGGPWVPASMNMKLLKHTETMVEGPGRRAIALAQIPATNGFSADIAVFAFPVIEEKPGAAPVGCRFFLDHDFAWQTDGEGIVEVSEDGRSWKEFCRFDANVGRRNDSVHCEKYGAFPAPVTAPHRRIRFRFWDHFLNTDLSGQVKVAKAEFTTVAGISQLDQKTLARRGNPVLDTYEPPADRVVGKDAAIDLTTLAKGDSFDWDVPAGKWRIVRLGFANNGRRNHPASEGGEGFEIDKLSAKAMDWHFDHYAGKLKGIKTILVDSYEAGSQNWTDGLEDEFEKRRGYRMAPFYPVFAGAVVGSVKESEKFLKDFRRTVADLFRDNFAGRLAARCHEKGMKLVVEPYGNCPSDDLEYGEEADYTMAEFWSRVERCGLRYTETGNARYAAYVAHVLGKRYVGAEAFTAYHPAGGRWLTTPYSIKAQGDRAFTEGVNRLVFHRFAHQPWTGRNAPKPGMTMGPWGMHLDRTQTWWKQGGEWMKYLGRCQWMLQEGTFVADLLFWRGTEAPNTEGHIVGFPADFPDCPVPEGLCRDVVSTRSLKLLKVKNGKIVVPGGTEYVALVVPEAERNHSGLVGKVVTTNEIAALGIVPDCVCLEAPGDCEKEMRFIHRRYDDGSEAYFVAVPNAEEGLVTCLFRQSELEPELWDAETGKTGLKPAAWRREGARTRVTWAVKPSGSMFVVFRAPRAPEGKWRLSFPVDWYSGGERVKSLEMEKLVDWTTLEDEDMKYFSGTATYEYLGSLKGVKTVDLGEVCEFAEVYVDGAKRETLWRPPYRFELPEGARRLEIRVTNLWPNRLIGDERTKAPDTEWKDPTVASTYRRGPKAIPEFVKKGEPSPTGRKAFATWHHWYKEEKLRPSGILGPVRFK